MTIEFIRYERPTSWATLGHSARLVATAEGQVWPTLGGARLVLRTRLEPRGALRLLRPVLGPIMRQRDPQPPGDQGRAGAGAGTQSASLGSAAVVNPSGSCGPGARSEGQAIQAQDYQAQSEIAELEGGRQEPNHQQLDKNPAHQRPAVRNMRQGPPRT
jgi:hypothetical protein